MLSRPVILAVVDDRHTMPFAEAGLRRQLSDPETTVVFVTSDPLAALAAAASHLPIDHAAGGWWRRIHLSFQRLFAGRHVVWVGTSFRALVLEPSVLALLSLRGFFSSVPRADDASRTVPTLIVTGD